MSRLCPFCLLEHDGTECNQGKISLKIPRPYINAVDRRVPVYPLVFIGYKGCGKTTFLSSLIYSINNLPDSWFSLRPLNQSTISKIEELYIETLKKGRFPRPTEGFIEEPLLLELTYRSYSLWELLRNPTRRAILVIYDTMGGAFDQVDSIASQLPIIKNTSNLVLLVDLSTFDLSKDNQFIDQTLLNLATKMALALEELGSDPRSKNLVVCFTKTDEFWDLNGVGGGFGPLAELPLDTTGHKKNFYRNNIISSSRSIQTYLREHYRRFHDFVTENYEGYLFVRSSNIGCKTSDEVVNDATVKTFSGDSYNPRGVIDPILWLLSL